MALASFSEKYRPNIQKALFHKDKVRVIQKWIKNLKDDYDNWTICNAKQKTIKPNFRKILLIYGPIACGKTTLVDILFKGFNKIDINSEDLKTQERVHEILNGIRSFDSISLESICKGKDNTKFNIIVIDNVELCDKYIKSFIDSIKTNIPIVLISSNSINVKNLLSKESQVTFLEINKVSLMELSQMIRDINIKENLNLNENIIKQIIEKSIFDVRQVFHILEQIKCKEITGHDCANITTLNIQEKYVDEDLSNKLNYIFSREHKFNYSKISLISSSDPQMISNGIYQNYIEIGDLNTNYEIINNITISDLVCKNIYTDQNWELFDVYSEISCVFPTYCIKKYIESELESGACIKEQFQVRPFKDISYNYINSFNELKELTLKNVLNTILTSKYQILKNIDDITITFKYVISMIIQLNNYFDSNKKGKNTSKKEKFDLYSLLSTLPSDDIHLIILNKLSRIIYTYRLFECDSFIEELKNNSNLSSDKKKDFIQKNIDKLDLRILKRYINFTSINLNTIKLIKTHTETSIKLKLFDFLLQEMDDNYIEKIKNIENNNKNVEEFSVSLSDLWKF